MDIFQKYDRDHSGQIEFNEFLCMFRDQLLDVRKVLDYVMTRGQGLGKDDAALIEVGHGAS